MQTANISVDLPVFHFPLAPSPFNGLWIKRSFVKRDGHALERRADQGTTTGRDTNGLLMAAAQAGDAKAYDQLLRRCIAPITTIARRRGVTGALIDDVVQDTLLTIHRVRHTYDPARPFSAWLGAIANRRAIDALRKHGKHQARELYDPIAYDSHIDQTIEANALIELKSEAERLKTAILTLPEGQRQAIEQIAMKDNSLGEAAVLTGKTTGALKVNFHRALKALKARLGGER